MSVHKKLMEARVLLFKSDLKKTGHNKFAGYMYFELSDFLPQIQEIFNAIGLCGFVSFGEDIAILEIVDIDDSSSLRITSPMKDANLKGAHAIQNLGAVQTYIRRYLWVTALEIVEHDALDSSEPLKDNKVAPPRESAKSIAADVWSTLDPETQNFLTDISMEAIAAFNDGDLTEVCRLFYENNLTQEEQTGLWSRFDSKMRSAIKKYRDEQKGS
jgi:hypothetical protein